jgi:predicted RNA-binding protein YlxR (DUF448 family)
MVRPVDDMIRFVLSPDGTAVPDLKRRLPGRGIWITATRQALRAAVAKKAFARGFKCDVRIGVDFVPTTERLIERAALDSLSMAHKAGRMAMGFAKAEAALLGREHVVGVLHAREASPDGVRKLASALRQREEDSPTARVSVIDIFTSAQMDLALGRSNVIHAAVLAGPESETFVARAARLGRFRTGGREHDRISTEP